ncbi:MAG: SPASM domain-containing protein [Elusimicrobiales bacterium]|jgi:radical SAM protein with 4Fe4S-binding SPASM domain
MFRRAFIEITNECNLACGFCAASTRPAAPMPLENFKNAAAQVKPFARVLSLHVLGEPFMHPRFPEILGVCSRLGLKINLVTNGTLLDKFGPALFEEKCLVQVSFSLHALAGLPAGLRALHLGRLTGFAAVKPARLIVGFRLRGSAADPFVKEASGFIFKMFPGRGERPEPGRAVKLSDDVYLNFGELFDWPGRGPGKVKKSCLGLRHHFAILSTGEVIPCCADHSGRLAVGNVNEKPLAEILNGRTAAALRDSLAERAPMPSYCRSCGFCAP